MNPTNIKVLFVAAIAFVLWGGYNVSKALYVSFTWNQVDGTVVDFEHNTWSCGKGIGECYSLAVNYPAGNGTYTVTSQKKYNRNKPTQLLKNKVPVYYSPLNPGDAILGGSYGPFRYGTWLFTIGCIVLLVFWNVHKRKQC